MKRKWYSKLQRPSSKVTDLPGFIDSLPKDYQETLDKLMDTLYDKYPNIQVLPVGGYSPYGFHVKYTVVPNSSGYEVCIRIIPKKTKGVRVEVRKNLGKGWVWHTENWQDWWQRIIISDNDIDTVVKHCHDDCSGKTL